MAAGSTSLPALKTKSSLLGAADGEGGAGDEADASFVLCERCSLPYTSSCAYCALLRDATTDAELLPALRFGGPGSPLLAMYSPEERELMELFGNDKDVHGHLERASPAAVTAAASGAATPAREPTFLTEQTLEHALAGVTSVAEEQGEEEEAEEVVVEEEEPQSEDDDYDPRYPEDADDVMERLRPPPGPEQFYGPSARADFFQAYKRAPSVSASPLNVIVRRKRHQLTERPRMPKLSPKARSVKPRSPKPAAAEGEGDEDAEDDDEIDPDALAEAEPPPPQLRQLSSLRLVDSAAGTPRSVSGDDDDGPMQQQQQEEDIGITPREAYLSACDEMSLFPLPILVQRNVTLAALRERAVADRQHLAALGAVLDEDGTTRLDAADVEALVSSTELPPDVVGCIDLTGRGLSDDRVMALALAVRAGLPMPLQQLKLGGNGMREAGAAALLRAVAGMRSLVVLELDGNPIGDEGVRALAAFAAARTCRLQELSLGGCLVGDKAGHVLVAALQERCVLTRLNLSKNDLSTCVEPLAEILHTNSTLVEVDLSWNSVRGDAALALAQILHDQISIQQLNLGWNSMGDVCEHIGESLKTNTKLLMLNLSFNNINSRGALVLSEALSINSTLAVLEINGNPLGPVGGRSMLRSMADFPGQARTVAINQCNLTSESGALEPFDLLDPGGMYELDLSVPYDRMRARLLLSEAHRQGGECWRGEKLNGRAFSLPEGSEGAWEGILSFQFVSHNEAPTVADIISPRSFECMMRLLRSHDPLSADFICTVITDYYFSGPQAVEIVRLFDDPASQVRVAARMFAQIPDTTDGKTCLMRFLTPSQARMWAARLGPYAKFNTSNPTGHYRMVLDREMDRLLALRLLQVNNSFKLAREKSGKVDVSQRGTWDHIRNECFNGEPFAYDNTFEVPHDGVLEFDFVSTVRPDADARRMPDFAFQMFLQTVRNYDALTPGQRLTYLRDISTTVTVAADQVPAVVGLFEGETHRVMAFVTLFGRIFDEENLHVALAAMTHDEQEELRKRLGYLNLFNPLEPGGRYQLNLANHEERVVCRMLCTLAVEEPGENWTDETYDRLDKWGPQPFDLVMSWVTDPPSRGILRLTYVDDDPKCRRLQVRRRLATEVLGWEFS